MTKPNAVLERPEHPQSWSFIIFGFNEEESVTQVLADVDRVGKVLASDYEILVVDDGSTDGSVARIEAALKSLPRARLIRHPRNLGIGQTLLTGYKAAAKDNVTAIPADGQFDPEELGLAPEVPPGHFISFYREKQTGYSPYRTALSRINRALNAELLGIRLRDVNWVKVYKTESLRDLDLRLRTSLVESEICAKLIQTGHAPLEVPSVYHQRRFGQSKAATLGRTVKVALETWRLAQVVHAFARQYRRKKRSAEPA